VAYAGFSLCLLSILTVATLRQIAPPTSAFMLHRHIVDFTENKAYHPNQQIWVDKKHISHHAFAAVIASEDQRFYQHQGFDTIELYKAYQHYLKGNHLRGASTISQQVAKNLFLSPSRNLLRKAAEVWFTLLIESLWPKKRILEIYLNIAEFGDHLYGIEAASQHYFRVAAKQLSPEQAALLAATLPNPKRLKASAPSPYLLKRQAWILKQMQNLKHRD